METILVTGGAGFIGSHLADALLERGYRVRALDSLDGQVHGEDERPAYLSDDVELVEGDVRDRGVVRNALDGVDAVVHLAWALQPGRRPEQLRRVNVEGSRRVARAAAAAGVAHVVHMSSIGAYAPGAVGQRVTEDWPTTGVPSSQYSRDKAEAERTVREVMNRHPGTTLTVVRPTLVLQPEASSEIGRYFLGPLLFEAARRLPGPVARRLPLPLPGLAVSFVHADDVADALERMLDRRVPGPFNLAAEPLMNADTLARALGTVRVPVPAFVLRTAVSAAFTAHVIPTEPGWLDMGIGLPALNTERARKLLDWTPVHPGDEVLAEFVAALGRGEGGPGPLLRPAAAQ
jgi:nucleoside-diphosphate-sugar epimerase